MRTLLQDLQYGFRVLRRNPEYSLLAILALALGIGANTALFSAVYGVLLKPLPYANGKRIVLLQQDATGAAVPQIGASVKELEDYRQQNHTFESLVEYHSMNFILLGREPDRVRTGVVSANYFDVLGVKPQLGRSFVPEDDKPGAPPVLILSNKYWQLNHGGDPKIVGKAFKMNDRMHTVIGVLPAIPQFPRENDVYMPTVSCPFRSNPQTIQNRAARLLQVFGTLKPGETVASGTADATAIARRFEHDNPADYKRVKNMSATLSSLHEQLTQRARPLLLILLATAGLVLLISCANVANLALARMVQREHEMAVRVSLGASRGRIVRQVLTECTMLSLAGGALGLLIASSGVSLLSTFMARFTNRAGEIHIDNFVLLFTLVISISTGLLFGIAPALNSSRRLKEAIQAGGRATAGSKSIFGLRNSLIVAQVGVSFVLLMVAGLMVRSFLKLQSVDAGYDPENVVAFQLPNNFTKYANPKQVGGFEEKVLAKLESLPGVTAVGMISGLPLNGPTPFMQPLVIENKQDTGEARPTIDLTAISPNALRAMGAPFLKGRDFNMSDTTESPGVAIIGASTAKHYWGDEDPIGRRISLDQGKTWLTVVGVAGDIRYFGLNTQIIDEVYISSTQNPGTGNVVIRTTMDPASMSEIATRAIHEVDPEQPVSDITTLAQIREESLAPARVTSMLLMGFAALALLLAATGLFGVISFLVNQRLREIGIRLALGAQKSTVLALILGNAFRVVAIGLVLGIVGALIATRAINQFLFGVSPTDWATFVCVSILLFTTAVIASYLPARRASEVDPAVTLRCE
jgi:putative ABC transport system permease protein